jgi:hypothetical protein
LHLAIQYCSRFFESLDGVNDGVDRPENVISHRYMSPNRSALVIAAEMAAAVASDEVVEWESL